MSDDHDHHEEDRLEQLVLTKVIRLNAGIHGIAFGLIVGLGIFIATNWLLIKGGPIGPEGDPIIGTNLALLGQYFIGYDVTFVGSLVGLAYGFLLGFAVGFFTAWLYNQITSLRHGDAVE